MEPQQRSPPSASPKSKSSQASKMTLKSIPTKKKSTSTAKPDRRLSPTAPSASASRPTLTSEELRHQDDATSQQPKSKLLSYHNEVLSLIDYHTIAARHVADAASKQIVTAVHLRRHAWLHTATITDDARDRIEDSPFDGEGLFAATTNELLDNILKMRKTARFFSSQSASFQPPPRTSSYSWRRTYPSQQPRT
ncbi:hypothetical protein JRQ81_000256 [Phrynocephalus forsythii]|uniref:Uncharacterized protein n=1 Tax=Phrynocephalus forsythii TaxID=171643 RepID=A0A9Q0Y7A1_9SAUR|nr:hypothetical protein JRQ81_000256 [Phrynocephalus forsythii]